MVSYFEVDWVIFMGVWEMVKLFWLWCYDLLVLVEISGKNFIIVIENVDYDLVVVDIIKLVFGNVG